MSRPAGRWLPQEAERLRIARELHDEVGQALTAVLLQLDRAQVAVEGEPAERIREARETARETLEEVRGIARNLRPEALDDLGLAAASAAVVPRGGASGRDGRARDRLGRVA